MLVPHSEDHSPTQSSVSHDSANSHGHLPWDEPHGAVPTRTGPGQDAPVHGLAPQDPHPADPVPTGWGSAGVDVSPGPGVPGSSGDGRMSTEGHGMAGSAGRGHEDSGEMGLAITRDINGATPQPTEQHGWAGMPEGMLDMQAGGQSHGMEKADLSLPTPQAPGWEAAGSAGSPHPAVSPPPAGADVAPVGQGGHQPELHTPTAPTSTPSVATTAPPVSLSPAMPGPATQLTSSGLTQQDALAPAMPTAPAHGPPTHTAESPLEWGTEGVSQHPDPALPHTELTSHGTPLSITAPKEPSPWAPPGTSASSDGGHELSQPTPLPPPLWEKRLEEEEALLPPSTTAAATAKPSWEVGNWSEVRGEPH